MTIVKCFVFSLLCVVLAHALAPPRIHQLHNLSGKWWWENAPESTTVSVNLLSWSQCSDKTQGIVKANRVEVTSSLADDSLTFPGTGGLSCEIDVAEALTTPLKARVELFKDLSEWIKIPCLGGIGSCEFSDACEALASIPPSFCPFEDCTCPIKKGKHRTQHKPLEFEGPSSVPSWLKDGQYKARFSLENEDESVVGCVEAIISVAVTTKEGEEVERLDMKTKRWEFAHAVKRNHDQLSDNSCDPDSFFYQTCNLTSRAPNLGCPVNTACHRLRCPLPGLCWLPKNCTCNPSTDSMNCTVDPTHQTECNSKDCGLCEDSNAIVVNHIPRYFTFIGGEGAESAVKAEEVPGYLSAEEEDNRTPKLALLNAPWHYKLKHGSVMYEDGSGMDG